MNIKRRSDLAPAPRSVARQLLVHRTMRLLLGTLIALLLNACWIAPSGVTCQGIGDTDCHQAVAVALAALPGEYSQTHGAATVERDNAPCNQPCAEFRVVVRITVESGDRVLVVNVQRAGPNAEMHVLGVQQGASS